MVFTKKNIKITLALVILIIVLLWCNIKKLYNSITKTTTTSATPTTTEIITDKFYNTPTTEKDNTPTTATATSTFNEIVYGMNPNCLKDNQSPDANKLCPGSHPNIPCSRIGCPTDSKTKLTDDMKRDIYLYAYLTGLLETADVWEEDTDKYWYTTNWRAEEVE